MSASPGTAGGARVQTSMGGALAASAMAKRNAA